MLAHNGKLYARVSDIIKPFVNFEGIAKETLDAKGLIGTEVHRCIEGIIKTGICPSVNLKKAKGYVESFRAWAEALKPTFVTSEERYYCDDLLITGQIDTLAKIQGEKECLLIDFKTSAQESPAWPLQAHLYYYLICKKGANPLVSKRFLFIQLSRYGELPTVFEYLYDERILKKCMQAVKKYWDTINVDIIP